MIRRHLLLAASAVAAAAPALAAAPGRPTAEALLARYVALKNAHDATRCAEIYAEDYVEHSGRNPSGLPALIANWQAQFEQMPDLVVTLEDQVFGRDRAVGRFTYSATHTRPILGIAPTGRRFSFGTIDIWRVKDGRLAEHWDQVDLAGLLRQLRAA